MEFWNPSDEEWNQIFKRDDLESVQKLFHLMELSEIMMVLNKAGEQDCFRIMKWISSETDSFPYFRNNTSLNSWRSKEIFLCFLERTQMESYHLFALSIEIGALECVKVFIEENKEKIESHSIKLSCHENQLEILKYFLEKEPHFLNNYLGDSGETLLTIASYHRHIELVKYLVQIGANIDISDGLGNTPFLIACNSGNFELVKFFVKLGCNVNAQSTLGEPLATKLVRNDSFEILEWLVEHTTIELDKVNDKGENALRIACRNKDLRTMKFLISKGVDVNHLPNIPNGTTALQFACIYGFSNVVLELLESPIIDLNKPTAKGDTALHLAIITNALKIVKLLVLGNGRKDWQTKSIDLNIKNANGNTPLRLILNQCFGDYEIETYLIEKEIIPPRNATVSKIEEETVENDIFGRIDNSERFEIIKLLVENGAKM